MSIVWWVWIVVGLILFGLELMTPGGFYLMFFGIAGIITGICAPLLPAFWHELLLYAVLASAMVFFLRKPLVARLQKSTPKADKEEFLEETAIALQDLAIGAEGKVELRGVSWNAQNKGEAALASGDKCTVVARDGFKLIVHKIS